MPPKPKFTREEMINAALAIISEKGLDALTARSLGAKLNASARPIFTVFENMDELLGEVRKAAMKRFEEHSLVLLQDMPIFKKVGMQMISFAINEPKLFQLLFMTEHDLFTSFESMYAILGDTATECIKVIMTTYGLSEEDAKTLFETVWIYTFGVGVLCANGVCRFSEKELSRMLTTEFQSVLGFLKSGSADEDDK